MPDGAPSLEKALVLNPSDFDAQSSLGGLLKRRGNLEGAANAYGSAARLSNGHPYPLLNELVLRAHVAGVVDLGGRDLQLRKAERARQVQAKNSPPYDAPWSAYDVALVRLLRGDAAGFTEYVNLGLDSTSHGWQAETFLKTLRLLPPATVAQPELAETLRTLEEASR